MDSTGVGVHASQRSALTRKGRKLSRWMIRGQPSAVRPDCWWGGGGVWEVPSVWPSPSQHGNAFKCCRAATPAPRPSGRSGGAAAHPHRGPGNRLCIGRSLQGHWLETFIQTGEVVYRTGACMGTRRNESHGLQRVFRHWLDAHQRANGPPLRTVGVPNAAGRPEVLF